MFKSRPRVVIASDYKGVFGNACPCRRTVLRLHEIGAEQLKTIEEGIKIVALNMTHSNLDKIVTLLKAMGNDNRFQILVYLADGERAVGELEDLLDLSQSALSQHLARLRRDGLVSTRRDAQKIYYSIEDDRVVDMLNTLGAMHSATEESNVRHLSALA